MEVNQPPDFDHAVELDRAKSIGASGMQLTFPWVALEPDAGQMDLDFLDFALGFYRDRDVFLVLSIPTIDTVSKLIPADLEQLPMNDPQVIARFETLLQSILALAGPELRYLVIGNEVNIFLGGQPQQQWDEFDAFIDAGAAVVNAQAPEIDVGISVTFGGIPDPRIDQLIADMDVAFLTYYFIGNDFGGTPADNVRTDIDAMIAVAGDKPLILKEFGYPTGEATGGTVEGQAEFIREAFTAWDEHATSFPVLTMSRMFDGVRTDCEQTATAYGFAGDEAFIQFLCTLGIRDAQGNPKPAWDELASQLAVRGF